MHILAQLRLEQWNYLPNTWNFIFDKYKHIRKKYGDIFFHIGITLEKQSNFPNVLNELELESGLYGGNGSLSKTVMLRPWVLPH